MENETTNLDDLKQPKERVSTFGYLLFFCILSIAVTLIVTVNFTKSYGFSLYIGLPSMIGFAVGFFVPSGRVNKVARALLLTLLVTAILSLLAILSGLEGGICIMMIVAPLFGLIFAGIIIGAAVRKFNLVKNNYIIISFFLINPVCLYVDSQQSTTENTVVSSVVIEAPAEKAWQTLTHRVDFKEQPDLLFRWGVNYPKNMQLITRHDSTFLHCDLRNGVTDLWVSDMSANRKLKFHIVENVIPVKELTIYDSLDTPHTHPEYFRLSFGQFLIQPLDTGHCRLIASSNFAFRLSPSIYWKWWSDYLVGRMHSRVINIVKEESESN
jgi:hypothetical protein